MKRIEDLLRDEATAILDEAALTIERLEHYHRDGAEQTRLRVEALYQHVVRAITARDLDGLAGLGRRTGASAAGGQERREERAEEEGRSCRSHRVRLLAARAGATPGHGHPRVPRLSRTTRDPRAAARSAPRSGQFDGVPRRAATARRGDERRRQAPSRSPPGGRDVVDGAARSRDLACSPIVR